MTETENKKSVKEPTNNVPEVREEVPIDDTVTVQFLRHCCTFEKGSEGRPVQLTHVKGSIASFKRSQLEDIILVEMFKARDISELNLPPRLYIMLGQ